MGTARLLLTFVSLSGAAIASQVDAPPAEKLAFWEVQRRGANSQNRSVEPSYWRAAAAAGIEFIRLAPDGWQANGRDFLIGDADAFERLDPTDLASLRRSLDAAHAAGVPVALTLFSLPGARWRQLNGGEDDARLWTSPGFRERAFDLWRQLAAALRDHPAIVAYNPLNEPHPERAYGFADPDAADFEAWRERVAGTTADLNAFNRGVVAAIREVDPTTPIILEGGFYASPVGLTLLVPIDGPAILYSFHYYEPWQYTTYRVNAGRFAYPDRMPEGFSRAEMARHFAAVAAWADKHGVPAQHIITSEFGVDRRVAGAREYLSDLITLLNERDWHWAFYAFRSDGGWGGMDYELGTAPLGAAYWDAVERGVDPESLKRRRSNPLWEVLAQQLDQDQTARQYGHPNPSAPPQLSRFAFLIGRWRCESRVKGEDGTYTSYDATWVGRYILDGYVIADEFRQLNSDGDTIQLGQTFRSYDPARDGWEMRWLDALNSTWLELGPEDLGGVSVTDTAITFKHRLPPGLEGVLPAHTIFRTGFYDISENHFVWRAEISTDRERTWEVVQVIEAYRVER